MHQKDVGTIFTFKIKLTITALLFVCGVFLIAIYHFFPDYRGELTFGTAVFGGLAVLYTAYYASETLKTQIDRDKVAKAFEFTGHLDDIDIVRIRVFVEHNIDHKHLTQDQVYDLIIKDREVLTAIIKLLGLLEDVSIAAQYGYIDETVAHESLVYIVNWAYNKLGVYISERRRITEDKTLYMTLEKLANSWKNKKSIHGGEL